MQKSSLPGASKVQIVKGDSTVSKVTLSDDQLLKEFPWDYAALILKIKASRPLKNRP